MAETEQRMFIVHAKSNLFLPYFDLIRRMFMHFNLETIFAKIFATLVRRQHF